MVDSFPDAAGSARGESSNGSVTPEEKRITAIVSEYHERLEAGDTPDKQALLGEYPELADRLAQYLDGLEFLHHATAPMIRDAHGQRGPGPGGRGGEVPKQLGDFTILREVGRGGMGVVYEATQESLGRRVALKILPFAAILEPKHLQRFKNEAAAAAVVDHPSIVSVHAVGFERGVHFYAMQFVDGPSLAETIAELRSAPDKATGSPVNGRGPAASAGSDAPSSATPPTDQQGSPDTRPMDCITTDGSTKTPAFFRSIAQLGIQTAEALDFAHQQGVIHRDIKPSNLLVDPDMRLWITDFGLALTRTTANLTMTGDLIGTLRYMSPEQAAGDRRRVDHRTDVYSLGATLYELATLEPLLAADTQQQLLRDISDRDPIRPRRINPAIPRDLETIILKAVAKDRDDRYVSAQAMAKDLGRFLDHQPVRARRVGPVGRTWRLCRRNPVLASVTTALFLSLAIGMAAALVFALQARRAESVARVHQEQSARISFGLQLARVDQLRRRSPQQALALLHDPVRCPTYLRDFSWGYLNWLSKRDRLTLQVPNSPVHDVTYTPDGKTIVSGSGDGFVRLWDAVDGRQTRSFRAHATPVWAIAVAPDGETLATGGGDKTIRIWSVATGHRIRSIKIDQHCIHALAFTANGKSLASLGNGGVALWDVKTGTNLGRFEAYGPAPDCFAVAAGGKRAATCSSLLRPAFGKGDVQLHIVDLHETPDHELRQSAEWRVPVTVRSVAWSSDRRFLAAGGSLPKGQKNDVWIYDSSSHKLKWTIADGRGSITGLRFSPDGRRIVTAAEDGSLRVWTLTADGISKATLDLTGHRGPIERMAFSPDGSSLATAGFDGTVKVWDMRRGGESMQLDGHADSVNVVAVSADGSIVASASDDRTIKLWALPSGRLLATMKGHDDDVCWLAFSPAENLLASAGWDGTVRFWEVPSGRPVAVLHGHVSRVYGVAFSPDGRTLASAGRDRTVRLWDVATRTERVPPLRGHTDKAWFVTFSPDGRTLASASRDRTVRLWDARTGAELAVLAGHRDGVSAVAYCPDGSLLASCGVEEDATVRIWDVRTRRLERTLKGHVGAVYTITFSPDGKTLASAGQDKTIRLWDPVMGVLRAALTGHGDWVSSIAFSPDSRMLLSASSDSTVRIWNARQEIQEKNADRIPTTAGGSVRSEAPRAIMAWDAASPVVTAAAAAVRTLDVSSESHVQNLAFSPDGKTLVSANWDGTGQIWSVPSGQCVATLRGHEGPMMDVAVSADGTRVATAGADGTIRFWDVRTGKRQRTLSTHETVYGVSFSHDAKWLVSAGRGPAAALWNTDSRAPVRILQQPGIALHLAFSPDGKWLALSGNRGMQVRAMPSGEVRIRDWRPGSGICALAFSPKGRILALAGGSCRQSISLVDCVDQRRIGVLVGHTRRVGAIAFFPNGDELVSSSDDGTVRLWDVRSRKAKAVLVGHGGGVTSLALSLDGATLATAGGRETKVLLWRTESIRR